MSKFINISDIPTAELREIRNVLKFGAKAYASRAGDEARRLAAENAELRKKDSRRAMLADIGIDIDDDESYWLNLSDSLFEFVVKKCSGIKKETAMASTTMTMKIPQVGTEPVLNTYETVREGLKARRNGG